MEATLKYATQIIIMTAFIVFGPSAGAQQLEEVVVTAERREALIQHVPLSVTAFSQEMLEKANIQWLDDLAYHVPGMTFSSAGDLKFNRLALRGVQSGRRTGSSDPAIGFYVDDVFVGSRVGSLFDLFDTQSVEVLRGPQGTLFGRNTIGGAVLITSRKPSEEPAGYIDLSYGNYNDHRYRFSVGGPLSQDKLFGQLSAVYRDRDGFTKNRFDGGTTNSQGYWAVRGVLRFLPTDNQEWNFSVDFTDLEQKSRGFEALERGDFLTSLGVPEEDPFDRSISIDFPGEESLEAWNASLTGEIAFFNVTLKSITAYRYHDYFAFGDTEASFLDWTRDGDPEVQKQFSQEIRLTSNSEGRFRWIGGLYYFDLDTLSRSLAELRPDITRLLGVPTGFIEARGDVVTNSFAVYGDIDFDITEKLTFSTGLRWTDETKEIDYIQTSTAPLIIGPIPRTVGRKEYSEITYAGSLAYHWTPDVMSYASVSEGFKGGGFNDSLASPTADFGFGPESALNYEVGLKTMSFEDRVRLNISAFRLDWKGRQITTNNPDTPEFDIVILNIGESKSEGIEVEFSLAPVDNLIITGTGTFLDTEVVDGGAFDLNEGDELPNSPNSFTISGDYTYPLPTRGEMRFRVDYLYEGEHFLSADNPDESRVEGIGFLGGEVSYRTPGEKWEISLWGKNLTNETKITRFFDLSGDAPFFQTLILINEPRRYGLSLRYSF
jgi:iron complex outermembrane receptor protein